ncbi:IclR family transcriptional regulator [Actinomycetospora termitidis]|uniref:IclR family transcriptional regulator n=1 Tax=Actinomycetospora termitidis TaxID=3053470 RepID=A0ABT7M274_9PSEU|nr:IclR family transcriptional regulator [Actinomycetospora sp. Odt1-22]MDL5154759.1 IclR family transcriptional regulator [Actinomycetospora sp. Odt1-22]
MSPRAPRRSPEPRPTSDPSLPDHTDPAGDDERPARGLESGGGQVHRALAILELLGDPESRGLAGPVGAADVPTSFGVVEIARTLGRDKSQVSRLLRLLADAGFVEREAGTLRYRIGTRLFSLGVRAVSRRLRDEADALVEREAALLGERVEVCVRSGGSSMTVATAAPDSELRAIGWVGRIVPLSCTATGRALLFDLDTAAVARLIVPEGLAQAGPGAPRSLDELVARIAEDRERGFSLARHEMDRGLLAVGAPVRDAAGGVVAAVGTAGPDSRIDPVLPEVSAGVLRVAADLTAALGGTVSPPATGPPRPPRQRRPPTTSPVPPTRREGVS